MSPAKRAIVAAAWLCSAPACFSELGTYEDPPGAGGGSAGNVGHGGTGVTTTLSGDGGFGGVTGGETCFNDRDDDGDELVDCADDDCGGYYCVPVPVDGFGLAAILQPGAACEQPAFPQPGPTGKVITAAPPKCPCSCEDLTVATACSANVQMFSDIDCNTLVDIEPASGSCTSVSSVPATAARASLQPTGGSCTGEALPAQKPTIADRSVCATPVGGGCEPGFVCARPVVDAPLCFYTEGQDMECDEIYDQRVVVFEAEPADERECSGTCGCAPPTGGTCSGQVSLVDTACGGSLIDMIGPGACESFGGAEQVGGIGIGGVTVTSQGSCAIVPRAETGDFAGPGTTLCCSDTI